MGVLIASLILSLHLHIAEMGSLQDRKDRGISVIHPVDTSCITILNSYKPYLDCKIRSYEGPDIGDLKKQINYKLTGGKKELVSNEVNAIISSTLKQSKKGSKTTIHSELEVIRPKKYNVSTFNQQTDMKTVSKRGLNSIKVQIPIISRSKVDILSISDLVKMINEYNSKLSDKKLADPNVVASNVSKEHEKNGAGKENLDKIKSRQENVNDSKGVEFGKKEVGSSSKESAPTSIVGKELKTTRLMKINKRVRKDLKEIESKVKNTTAESLWKIQQIIFTTDNVLKKYLKKSVSKSGKKANRIPRDLETLITKIKSLLKTKTKENDLNSNKHSKAITLLFKELGMTAPSDSQLHEQMESKKLMKELTKIDELVKGWAELPEKWGDILTYAHEYQIDEKDPSKESYKSGSSEKENDSSKERTESGSSEEENVSSKERNESGSSEEGNDSSKERNESGSSEEENASSKERTESGSSEEENDSSKARTESRSSEEENDSSKKRNESGSSEEENVYSKERNESGSSEEENASSKERTESGSSEEENDSSKERNESGSSEGKNDSSKERNESGFSEDENDSSKERNESGSSEGKNDFSKERKESGSSEEENDSSKDRNESGSSEEESDSSIDMNILRSSEEESDPSTEINKLGSSEEESDSSMETYMLRSSEEESDSSKERNVSGSSEEENDSLKERNESGFSEEEINFLIEMILSSSEEESDSSIEINKLGYSEEKNDFSKDRNESGSSEEESDFSIEMNKLGSSEETAETKAFQSNEKKED